MSPATAPPISRSTSIQLGLSVAICAGMLTLAWQAWTMKSDAMREIREQYVNKDLFNAKFDIIALQLATQNEKLSDLKTEVSAIRNAGERR